MSSRLLLTLGILAGLTAQSASAQQFGPAIGPPSGFVAPTGQIGQPQAPAPGFPAAAPEVWTDQRELTRLRALLVIDTNATNSQDQQRNLDTMYALLTGGIPQERLDLTVLRGDDATPARVLDYYRNLNTGPDEAVLFFYSGHGGMDRARQLNPIWARGHFLAMKAGTLYRSDLFNAIQAKRPGLIVLFTDCCSTLFGNPDPNNIQTSNDLAEAARAGQLSPLCRCLFFQHRGIVDRTASYPGNFSWSDSQIGGYYTSSIGRIFAAPQRCLPNSGRGFVNWATFDQALSRQVVATILERRANVAQLPSGFSHAAPVILPPTGGNQIPAGFGPPPAGVVTPTGGEIEEQPGNVVITNDPE